MREAVLPNRLWAALQKLNPDLVARGAERSRRRNRADRSAMLPDRRQCRNLPAAEEWRACPCARAGRRAQDRDRARRSTGATLRANDFLIAQQVWFQGELYKRRADLVGFVNGLPLLLIELKGPGENVKDAFDNNIRSYRADIPQVFTYNAAIIVSNGMETKVGATHAPYEHFIEWKKAESEDEPPAAGLEVAIRGIGTAGAPARSRRELRRLREGQGRPRQEARQEPPVPRREPRRRRRGHGSTRSAASSACSGTRRARARACRCCSSRRRFCARSPATGPS